MTRSDRPVALIVGMGPGLSAALARRFATGGFVVAGFARDADKSAGLAAEVAATGGRLEMRSIDAGDFSALRQGVVDVEREVGPIDVLIYNAYRATPALPSALSPAEMVADFRVNVAGGLAAAQAALPFMRDRGRGTMLLTGGGLALDPTGWLAAASLAVGKAGLRSLARSLHAELTPEGLRVSTVTIAGMIAQGTSFAPERVAETFWHLHDGPVPTPAEVVYTGES